MPVKYEKLKRLGGGGGGEVHSAKDLENEGTLVALKELKGQFKPSMRNEFDLVASLSHPNIVKMLEIVEDADSAVIVMELVEGQSLRAVLKTSGPLTLAVGQKVFRQLVQAVSFVHSHGIVHRDIKVDNVMLVSLWGGQVLVKLVDFGLCVRGTDAPLGVSGTPKYLAPEVIAGTVTDLSKVDVWALSIFLFEILLEDLPKPVNDSKVTILDFQPIKMSLVKDVLRACHVGDPAARATAAELLETEWLRDAAESPDVTHAQYNLESISSTDNFYANHQSDAPVAAIDVLADLPAAQLQPLMQAHLEEYTTPEARQSLFAKVKEIFRTKLHLGASDVNLASYADILKHVGDFEEFQQVKLPFIEIPARPSQPSPQVLGSPSFLDPFPAPPTHNLLATLEQIDAPIGDVVVEEDAVEEDAVEEQAVEEEAVEEDAVEEQAVEEEAVEGEAVEEEAVEGEAVEEQAVEGEADENEDMPSLINMDTRKNETAEKETGDKDIRKETENEETDLEKLLPLV